MLAGRTEIWVVEDDPGCCFLFEEVLGKQFALTIFNRLQDFSKALSAASADSRPAMVVADLNLPDGTWLELFEKDVAASLQEMPFLVVSSANTETDLRTSYQAGARDYLIKPFSKGELLVKVERCLGFQQVAKGAISFNLRSFTVSRLGRTSEALTSRELQIMTVFASAADHLLTRSQIVNAVWKSVVVTPKTLDVHLFNLRRKLSPLGLEIQYLSTGTYQLVGLTPTQDPKDKVG
jgi:DNA-binding response OmpR family regulator